VNTQTFSLEEGNKFIIECHFDLDTVERKLAENQALASAYNAATIESALSRKRLAHMIAALICFVACSKW